MFQHGFHFLLFFLLIIAAGFYLSNIFETGNPGFQNKAGDVTEAHTNTITGEITCAVNDEPERQLVSGKGDITSRLIQHLQNMERQAGYHPATTGLETPCSGN